MPTLDDLETILRLIDRIEQTIARETAESFRASRDAVDAVSYRLGMIGEHCKRLPDELKERHPDIPWHAMVSLRNIVAHSYDNVSPAIIWRTATEELDAVHAMALVERQRRERTRDERDNGREL